MGLGLGPTAESFLRTAAAAGTLRLEHELTAIVDLVPVWARDQHSGDRPGKGGSTA